MRMGALVYNPCTVSSSQISLMTSSHSAERKKGKKNTEENSPRKRVARARSFYI